LVWGTFGLLEEFQTSSIIWTKQLFAPDSHKIYWHLELFDEHFQICLGIIMHLYLLQQL
jgi:hypothetical protein